MTPLAKLLSAHEIPQSEVAEALRVSRQTVWQWVHGGFSPGARNLLALTEFLQRWEPELRPHDLVEAA